MNNIIHVNVFLKDMRDFDKMDRACIEMLGDHRPARTRDRGKRSSETERPGHDISDCRLKRLMPEWREKPAVYPGKG